jgi:hypothetical protein
MNEFQIIYKPLEWQKQGLSQTASGYGKKITTSYMIMYQGRLRRIYSCCYSNSGAAYIIVNKQDFWLDRLMIAIV